MAAIVALRGLTLAYGTNIVLQGLDLELARGEFVAIVGASGVGKSTLLRVLAGLSAPSAGTVESDLTKDPARRGAALVFQDSRLLPWRRVQANVEFGLEGLGLGRAERRTRAEQALDLVGLAHFAKRWPYQLSGGQRQRVGLARALAVRPDLLLLDEPFGALDAMTRQTLQDEMLRLWRASGASILMVTHDLEEAVYLADRVILLGGSPASVTATHRIDDPRPRQRGVLNTASLLREELFRVVHQGAGI